MNAETPLKDLIAQLRVLNARATPGNWRMAAKPSSIVGWPILSEKGRSIASLTYVPGYTLEHAAFNEESEANGKRICALDPDTLGRLLDVAEAAVELRKTVDDARAVFVKYGELHEAKGTEEGNQKALANFKLAATCQAAINAFDKATEGK